MKGLRASDPATIGRYRIVGVLGSGGMGRVLLGESPDGRLVAVKVVHPHLAIADNFRSRFRQEVAASRAVSGAYTAAVMDADPDAEVPWLASVFVPGPSLSEAVDAGGPLPEESVLRLAAGLAAALGEIHRAGLIHRDLKPSNVLLTDDGPRVIDFGIARAAEMTTLTHTGAAIGSPAYMSPEQALGQRLTPASDMFSLGSLLHLAATGVGPFTGESAPQLLYQVVHGELDLSRVPPALSGLVTACLDRDPAARPTPEEVLARIGPGGGWPPPGVAAMIESQRRQARELRSGAAGGTRVAPVPTPPGPLPATRYATPVPPPVLAEPPRRTPRWAIPAVVIAVLLAVGVPLSLLLLDKDQTAGTGSGDKPPGTVTQTVPPKDSGTTAAEEPSGDSDEGEGSAEPGQDLTIGPDGYRDVRLNMTISDAVATGQVAPTEGGSGCESFEMFDENGAHLGFVWAGDNGVIVTISPVGQVYTPEGITIGSTLDDIAATYPDVETAEHEGVPYAYAPVPDNPNAVYTMELAEDDTVVTVQLQDVDDPC